MGESGAGKTSLLRAGLSHILKDKDTTYIYWEALPSNSVESLLHTIGTCLNGEFTELSDLLTFKQKAVIVLDQFEQLLPENPEHEPIFNLLKQISSALPPHKVTWFVAFCREYAATWRDFELDSQLYKKLPHKSISCDIWG